MQVEVKVGRADSPSMSRAELAEEPAQRARGEDVRKDTRAERERGEDLIHKRKSHFSGDAATCAQDNAPSNSVASRERGLGSCPCQCNHISMSNDNDKEEKGKGQVLAGRTI